jgi:hypothetical protein
MKKIQILVSAMVVLMGFSAGAAQVIDCESDTARVQLLLNQDKTNLTVELTRAGGTFNLFFDAKKDAYSAQASRDLYTDTDLATAQKTYNSVVVLKVPHGVAERQGRTAFLGRLEFRDYDHDYLPSQYLSKDKGPGANGYVLKGSSETKLSCVSR